MTLESELERIMEQIRELRESNLNPCKDEDAQGECACHSFDHVLDLLEKMMEMKKGMKKMGKKK